VHPFSEELHPSEQPLRSPMVRVQIEDDATAHITGTPVQAVVAALQNIGAQVVLEEDDAQPDFELEGLSTREQEILALIGAGFSNKEIAVEVFLSVDTIKLYVRSAFRKLGIRSRSEVVLYAISHGLVDPHHPRKHRRTR
jgi:DNA-binding NarL/FixJ family response regulator